MASDSGPAEPSTANKQIDPTDTRTLLLETGRQLVLQQGMRESIDLKVSEVVAAANRTTGSAYQIWASQADYQQDLAIYIAETFEWIEPFTLEGLEELVAADLSFHELIASSCQLYFDRLRVSERFYLSLRFWSVQNPSPELSKAISGGYITFREGFTPIFETALDVYQRRVREPYTMSDITIAMNAVSEGIALRVRFDPDVADDIARSPQNVFSAALIGLAEQFTEPIPADS